MSRKPTRRTYANQSRYNPRTNANINSSTSSPSNPDQPFLGDSQFSDPLVQLPRMQGFSELMRKLKIWTTLPYQNNKMNERKNMRAFAMCLQSAMVSPNLDHKERTDLLLLVLDNGCPEGSRIPVLNGCARYVSDILRSNQMDTDLLSHAWLPTLTFLTTEVLLSCTNSGAINTLYTAVDDNIQNICETAASVSWSRNSASEMIVYRTYKILYLLLRQYNVRFHTRLQHVEKIRHTLKKLKMEIGTWLEKTTNETQVGPDSSRGDRFASLSSDNRKALLVKLEDDFKQLDHHLARWDESPSTSNTSASVNDQELHNEIQRDSQLVPLAHTWVAPGGRHSNDHSAISEITCFPTAEELLCDAEPSLPANIPFAPHHIHSNGVERQIDTCFRLMREDFIAPIRNVLKGLWHELNSKTSKILQTTGPFKLAHADSDIICSVFHEAKIESMHVNPHSDDICLLVSAKKKQSAALSKPSDSLLRGSLVGLLAICPGHKPPTQTSQMFHLGILDTDVEYRRDTPGRLAIRMTPLDIKTYSWGLAQAGEKKKGSRIAPKLILFEIPHILVNVSLPYLEALRRSSHLEMPFGRYLGAPMLNQTVDTRLAPPSYSTRAFSWNISADLLSPQNGDNRPHRIDLQQSLWTGRLAASGALDTSQAAALVHCLASEVALIQGPPGTGKSHVGTRIVETLIKSNIRPIQIMCVTNHALDQFLESLLRLGVTSRVVRLGNRSKSEVVRNYSLNARKAVFNGEARRQIGRLKDEIKILSSIIDDRISFTFAANSRVLPEEWLRHMFPLWFEEIAHPPIAIEIALQKTKSSQWTEVKAKQAREVRNEPAIADWIECRDLKARTLLLEEELLNDDDVEQTILRFEALSVTDKIRIDRISRLRPNAHVLAEQAEATQRELKKWLTTPAPDGSRDADEILENNISPWHMSLEERQNLYQFWLESIRIQDSEELLSLREKLRRLNDNLRAIFESEKSSYLRSMDIIACTTSGAATHVGLIRSAAPQVMLVEEAGEVLEGQVWACLTPSIQHLILIGDHRQLRPHINSYNLSMDSKTGKYYRADQSMFERLVNSKLDIACLGTQRRMRPDVSSLIKNLYPGLQDHYSTTTFPDVIGMSKNVVFMTHQFPEDIDKTQHTSHSNKIEATFVVALTRYLLLQGYNGRISILTPYVKQVSILQGLCKKDGITFRSDVIDELNRSNWASISPRVNSTVCTSVSEPPQVRITSIDNFQGEEDDIIILSLVRNSAPSRGKQIHHGSIGFLKSENRCNVALSRARHGLYILGDAGLLQNSTPFWKYVISNLEDTKSLCDGIPILCKNHRETRKVIQLGQQFEQNAPDGGCLRPCGAQRPCGHICSRKCHPDDSEHKQSRCTEPCPRLLPGCDHPCPSLCHPTSCPKCLVYIKDVALPCGHVARQVPCQDMGQLSEVKCSAVVSWRMPCGHEKNSPCHEVKHGTASENCNIVCNQVMGCCGQVCKSKCSDCRRASLQESAATPQHASHSCEKKLHCGHRCQAKCHNDSCPPCSERCNLNCEHHICKHSCGSRCVPCQNKCNWSCPHQTCDLPCVAPCSRPVCNERCGKKLKCGHECPSVCGEDCSHQNCILCGSVDVLDQVADFLDISKKLGQLRPDQDPGECIITLECRHSFTVESLDGYFQLHQYYDGDRPRLPDEASYEVKVCPNCRHPIKTKFARRYTRPILFGKLQLLEREGLRQSTFQLKTISDALGQGGQREDAGVLLPEHIDLNKTLEVVVNFQIGSVKSEELVLIDPDFIFDLKFHGFTSAATRLWKNILGDLELHYREIYRMATQKQPMQEAFEAGLTHIYHRLEKSTPHDVSTSETSDSLMLKAREQMGSCPPPSINRIVAESCIMEDAILVKVIEFANEAHDRIYKSNISTVSSAPDILSFQWTLYISFLLNLRVRNKKTAALHAAKLGLVKNTAQLWELHASALVEQLRDTVPKHIDAIAEEKDPHFANSTSKSTTDATDRLEYGISRWEKMYGNEPPIDTLAELDEAKKNCDSFKATFGSILHCIETNVWVDVTTIEIKKMIIKAMGFQGTFHWFKCVKGHQYCIGECGGAMEQSTCPVCGSPIGGQNHRLDASNARDQEMEALTLETGARYRGNYNE